MESEAEFANISMVWIYMWVYGVSIYEEKTTVNKYHAAVPLRAVILVTLVMSMPLYEPKLAISLTSPQK